MTAVLLLLVGLASAEGLPALPVSTVSAPGECPQSIGINKGASVPSALMTDGGLARCSAVAEPLSSYAHLLQLELHAELVHTLYQADLSKMRAERDFYRHAYDQARIVPLTRRPWFVAVTSSALVGVGAMAYSWSAGAAQ